MSEERELNALTVLMLVVMLCALIWIGGTFTVSRLLGVPFMQCIFSIHAGCR